MAPLMSMIIGVCGGSAAGKSSLALELKRLLGPGALLLSMDRYYSDIGPITPEERADVNFDEPEAFDLDLLAQDMDRFKSGKGISVPIYDYHTCHRLGASDPILPNGFLILEGLFLLSREIISSRLDYSVFVEVSEATRIQRRMDRDMKERQRTREMVLQQLHETVLPMHHLHIDPFKANANFLVSNETSDVEKLKAEAARIISKIKAS